MAFLILVVVGAVSASVIGRWITAAQVTAAVEEQPGEEFLLSRPHQQHPPVEGVEQVWSGDQVHTLLEVEAPPAGGKGGQASVVLQAPTPVAAPPGKGRGGPADAEAEGEPPHAGSDVR